MNVIPFLLTLVVNVFRTFPTAATATSGVVAGATLLLDRAPSSTTDWVILTSGAIGMIANVIHANLTASVSNREGA